MRYAARLSGPLLDRIDLHVEVPPVVFDELERGSGESSAAVAARVARAREKAVDRNTRLKGRRMPPRCNADLGPGDLKRLPPPSAEARRLLRASAERFALTARTWHRLLKVAWTIADLEGAQEIGEAHVAEAIHYRVGRREAPLSHSGTS